MSWKRGANAVEMWSELLGGVQIGGGSGLGFDTGSRTVSVGGNMGSEEIYQEPRHSVAVRGLVWDMDSIEEGKSFRMY